MRADAMILVFWMLSFKPTFSLSSFTFICSSSSLSATRQKLPLVVFMNINYNSTPACGSVVKNRPANAGDAGSASTFRRSSQEGNGDPLQCSCLESPMDSGVWRATVHGVAKGQTQLSDFPFTFHFHALEKEMATHSSILAWRIPGTGEPGGLPSMGSHRVGHDWSDLAAAAASSHFR